MKEKLKPYYIVREWLVSSSLRFENLNDAQKEYDRIIKEGGDIDVELLYVLAEYNNIKGESK
jgi:hypothetical protein